MSRKTQMVETMAAELRQRFVVPAQDPEFYSAKHWLRGKLARSGAVLIQLVPGELLVVFAGETVTVAL